MPCDDWDFHGDLGIGYESFPYIIFVLDECVLEPLVNVKTPRRQSGFHVFVHVTRKLTSQRFPLSSPSIPSMLSVQRLAAQKVQS